MSFWSRFQAPPQYSSRQKILHYFVLLAFVIVFGGFILGTSVFLAFGYGLPDIRDFENLAIAQSTLIMDREGNILYAVHGEENREIVPLGKISPYLKNAALAMEDENFYQHFGFDPFAIGRAIINNLRGLPTQGASTITQQLAKNLFLSPERTYTRKIQELILSIRIELFFTKDEILEMYLNEIAYGNNSYGAERAAKTYFGKSAQDLTLGESAILAALPKAPTRYSPYGEHRYSYLLKEFPLEEIEKRNIQSESDLKIEEFSRGLMGTMVNLDDTHQIYLRGRTDLVLARMAELAYITENEKETAWQEIQKTEFKLYRESIEAPHFVFYVKELLEEKYGKEFVEQGGLKVYTTLDPTLQDLAEQAISERREFNKNNFNATNASLVAIQPQTGQILALVGSADYFDEEIDGNVNIALRLRQPGSAFKPLVYALTFLKRYTPATIIYDVETRFGNEYPRNYEGGFMGPIPIRVALGKSRNLPAIKAYFLAGEETEIIPFVEKFGIKTLDPDLGYGWPLGIGSGEVRLLDLTAAYGVFANSGVKKEVTPILKIENAEGEVLEQWKENTGKEEVLDPQVAYLINDILKDQSVSLGPNLFIDGWNNAAKTGTSNKKLSGELILPNNIWAIGYTTKLVAGVWAGNSDGGVMTINADGYNGAAPIWKTFMTEALKDMSPEQFTRPAGIKEIRISKASGKLPSEFTPEDQIGSEIFAGFAIPTEIDNAFQEVSIDTFTNKLANEWCPTNAVKTEVRWIHHALIPEYTNWEEGVKKWAEENNELVPEEICDLHTEETAAHPPYILITSPAPYTTIPTGKNKIEVQAEAENGIDRVEFYFDDRLQYTSTKPPYSGTIRIGLTTLPGSTHQITAEVFDAYEYGATSTIEVKIESAE